MPRKYKEAEMPKKTERVDQTTMISHDVKRLTDFWNSRNIQMQQDRDLINLVPPEKKTSDKQIRLANDPKVIFDTSRSLISLNEPRFRLPITMNPGADEKDKMNKAERLCIGIHRAQNDRVADTGGTLWLYDLAYWVLLGSYATFDRVEQTDEGVCFLSDIWDPINVYPEWDSYGLKTCIRAYEVDKITARAMAVEFNEKGLDFEYREPKQGENYNVVNYWVKKDRKVFNAIMLNGGLVKPLTLQRNLDRIPILTGGVGSPDKISVQWQSRWGESIIASVRNEIALKTELRELRTEIIAETAYPNIVTKTRSGQPAVKGENMKGHGAVVALRLEDQIEMLKHAATPNDVNVLDVQTQADIQKGSFPSVLWGNLAVDTSGFGISQLMAAIKYKAGPYLNALQYIRGRSLSNLLYQYRRGNFGKVTLSTTNPYDMKRGMTYMEEFSKDDVPERIYVEAAIPISSQFDKTQAILNAVQALQSGLLSRETLWENELDVQDSEQEKQRIIEDQVANDPFVRQLEIILRMRERVQVYRDANMLDAAAALERYIATLEQGVGITNKGTPPSPTGVPPQQRPVEMTPGSPDILNAATDTPPPKPNMASRNAKSATMFTPDGQPIM